MITRSASEAPDEERCSQLRLSILKTDLSAELLESFAELPDVALAVRSSASVEDSARGSYSGLFRTCLGVRRGRSLTEAVKEVWALVFTPQALTYHRKVSQARDYPLMAILIMPLLNAEAAGVAFSANPVDGNPFQIVVTACLGLGTTVVDGAGGCDRYVLDLDSLDILETHPGSQKAGDFAGPDGNVERRPIPLEQAHSPILSEMQLRQLGEVVRSIDDLLERRVDVEFTFHTGGLSILQAREIVGLPPFFPDNPAEKDKLVGCGHQTWGDPLPPFLRTVALAHPQVPSPPWPLEVDEVFFHLGRVFGRSVPSYGEGVVEGLPEVSWTWNYRAFLQRMEALDDPERYAEDWWPWTRHAYQHIIPDLRQRSEKALSLSERELDALDTLKLGRLLRETIAGLVYEDGNWLCHESNLCRELGKPAVVCMGDKIDLIQPGERLRIDGSKGTVHRLGI
ncbi:MAG: hypothetical protein A3F84_00080 [Candidatus Handelsmanbacteria bacterium RIFCSPLOWO2_12_FULL_64_10]|uniref:Pyruvate phosphate dikinase AMP/ATP-binding domain-containing protein n=1 Tax=Handelsmanbacteria sp. (strain RIFCSPLOWO2_12_FULL_64_10) TaxID=1817868 RepID=A0A1F6CP24_HANXR|nr:MAG: hypothetical protein A3F84_00080 [Candidatus Handelsmanbacteria bacterium RIFCSPLOWO2_12_FULL_64_10]